LSCQSRSRSTACFLATDETPHFIGLRFKTQELNDAARFTDLDIEIVRLLGIDLDDEAEQPGQADFGDATNAAQAPIVRAAIA
jgi:hypothetical protein